MAATAVAPQEELRYLPVEKLRPHPANPRADVGDVSDLVASIREMGVRVPLLVEPIDGEDGFYVIAGTRRRVAALEAKCKLVPCLVDVDADKSQLTASRATLIGLVENERRKQLTVAERSRAYAQLQLDGMKPDVIARSTASALKEVKALLSVAKSSDKQLDAIHRHDLTLEQAAGIAEFVDDDSLAAALIDTAVKEPSQFAHVLARLRQDRKDAVTTKRVQNEWSKRGYTVIIDSPPPSARPLSELSDVDDDSHGDCLGKAVRIDVDWFMDGKPRVTHFCLDWEANEHTLISPPRNARSPQSSASGEDDSEQQKSDRREVRENNAAWRAATTVRRQFVVDLLKRRTVSSHMLMFVAEMLLTSPSYLSQGTDETLEELTGRQPLAYDVAAKRYGAGVSPAGASVLDAASGDKQITLAMLAQVASAFESTMDEQTWRSRHDREARWLRFLGVVGYSLSPVEQLVIDEAKIGED